MTNETPADGDTESMVAQDGDVDAVEPYAAHLADMKAKSGRDAAEYEHEIRQRLVTMYSHRGDGIPTQFVNPDGRAAVSLIDNHKARADRAEAARKAAHTNNFHLQQKMQVLVAENVRLRAAMMVAVEQFDYYTKSHRAKRTEDGDSKAETNAFHANRLRDAMSDPKEGGDAS